MATGTIMSASRFSLPRQTSTSLPKVLKTLNLDALICLPPSFSYSTKASFTRPISATITRSAFASFSTAALSPSRASAAESLQQWLTECGLPESPLSLKVVGDCGVGCVAQEPIARGQEALLVPENFCITAVDAANTPEIAAAAEGRGELVALTLWLLWQKAQGEASPWLPYIKTFPESTLSPILWTEEELDTLLRGSPVAAVARERAAALNDLFLDLASTHFLPNPTNFPPHIFNLDSFKAAFVVVLSRAVNLPSADVWALVPFADFFNHSPSSTVLIDYDEAKQAIVVRADKNIQPGEELLVSYGYDRPNIDFFLNYGFVPRDNPSDFLLLPVGLVPTDPIFSLKEQIVREAGFSAQEEFPIFPNRFPRQLLSYLRLARVQDPILLAKVTFERDVVVNESNEYEVLMLLLGDCKDRLQAYSGNLEDDQRSVNLGKKRESEKEQLAARVRLGEKVILSNTITALRNRLAPIRGIPTKKGMEDPNADIKEIFDIFELGIAAPAKIFSNMFGGNDSK